MDKPRFGMAQQIAQAARAFERRRTGHELRSVTAVLSGEVLVVNLHGALTRAEKNLARDPDGAAQLQAFHQQLFAHTAAALRNEIEKIIGVKVRGAAAEIEPSTGTVARVCTTGTVVQVFLLADGVRTDAWSDDEPAEKV